MRPRGQRRPWLQLISPGPPLSSSPQSFLQTSILPCRTAMADSAESPLIPSTTSAIIFESSPPNEPPPPYPSRERRRMRAGGRRRRTVGSESDHHLQIPSAHSETEYEVVHGHVLGSPFPPSTDEHEATETTPLLLSNSPRLPPGGIGGRQRTLSITSTAHSVTSFAPSFAHTVLSAFRPERDCDLDPDVEHDQAHDPYVHDYIDSPRPPPFHHEHARLYVAEPSDATDGRSAPPTGRWRRYFRPMTRRSYYTALSHLLFLNFPYALIAWLYLFVFTLVRPVHNISMIELIICDHRLEQLLLWHSLLEFYSVF